MSKSKNMRKRRGKGAGLIILIFSIIAFIVYAYFLLGTDWGIVVLRLTVLGAVTALLAVLAWIGYTMATAPELEGP
jgi:predicted DNA-binding transcriptional regulator